jgi:thiol-disulfide isomerase/thioredoxin
VLKGHELLTVPLANGDLWSWRAFLIFQVEFELALGIWLLSGLFRRLAWLAALLCFGLFCAVTLYKGLMGAASCGCFGRVHVNPWVTLLAVDLPAAAALGVFRPSPASVPLRSCLRSLSGDRRGDRESLRRVFTAWAQPRPSLPRFALTAVLYLATLILTVPILALHKPAAVTSTYEVLEPETWVGRELPILQYIDIAEKLGRGRWLAVLYHHDCPDCQRVIPEYEQMAKDWKGNTRIVLIEMAPYDPLRRQSSDGGCARGRLSTEKEWIVKAPVVCLLADANVIQVWEGGAPVEKEMRPPASRARSPCRTAHTIEWVEGMERRGDTGVSAICAKLSGRVPLHCHGPPQAVCTGS